MANERSDIVRDANGFEVPDLHSSSKDYAARFSGAVGRWFLDVQEKATYRSLAGLPPGQVLDAGGGHGQNLPLLLRAGHEVTVLGSARSCAAAVSPFLERGEARFRVGPLTAMPFPDGSFDVVLSYRMLAHLLDWRVHITELCRVSRRAVVVEFPVRRGFNALSGWLFGAKRGIEGNTRPYTLFDEAQIRAEFERHNFQLIGRQSQFFWPLAFHRLHRNVALGRALESLPGLMGLTGVFGSPMIARFDRKED